MAVAAITVLALAFGVTQLGPGGLLSDVRPGKSAPDFDVPLLDGGRVALHDLRGRPVALSFWATWCPPCVVELPMMADAEKRHADVGLAVVLLNAGQHHEYVASFMKDRGLDMPVAIDPGKDTYDAYGVVGLPTTVWIDGAGMVRAVELGALTPEKIDGYVAELAGNRSTSGSPPDAGLRP